MASGWTNKGKAHVLGIVFQNIAEKANYYMALATDAATPTVDTNTFGQLTEIANGNGYTTGGYQLTPGNTDFDVLTEDDSGDKGLVQVKDVAWTASGGSLPGSGSGARWAVLLDNNATVGSREVYAWWDLTSNRSVTVGQVFTLQNLELDIT
jgi:hypothetical protein